MLVCFNMLVALIHYISKLRNIVPCIALSRDLEVMVFVLRKPLEPIHQEIVGVLSDKTVIDAL